MGVGFNFQIFLEVAGQKRQRLLLAGKQSAVWILHSRLRGWEINTMESKSSFQSLLFGRGPRRRRRSLDIDLSGSGTVQATGIRTTCVHGDRSGLVQEALRETVPPVWTEVGFADRDRVGGFFGGSFTVNFAEQLVSPPCFVFGS